MRLAADEGAQEGRGDAGSIGRGRSGGLFFVDGMGGATVLSAQRGRPRAQGARQLVRPGDLPRPGRDGGLPPRRRCRRAAGALVRQAGPALSQVPFRLPGPGVDGLRVPLLQLPAPANVALRVLPVAPVGVREQGVAGRSGGFSADAAVSLLGPPSAAPGGFGLLLAPVPLGGGLHPVPLVGGPATVSLGPPAPASRGRSPPLAGRIWAEQGALGTLLPAVSRRQVSGDVQVREMRRVGGQMR